MMTEIQGSERISECPATVINHLPDGTARRVVNHLPDGTARRVAHLPAPESPEVRRWFALRIRSNFAFRIQSALERDGIEDFLPTYVEQTRWTDRTKQITLQLFPGYLFARFDRFHDAAKVHAIPGIFQILGHEIDSIPDEQIASLRLLVASPAAVTPCRYLSGVSEVRVNRGPYAGATGVVISTRGKSFLTINIEAFGRACKVEFDIADVKPETLKQ
jgi:transcriptional antiterminator RfaH